MASKILLCEDEEFVARSYIRKLELEGFVVQHVYNGQQALDVLFSQDDIDLVLLDLMMQIKSGYDVLTEIRSCGDDRVKQIPIVVASNFGQKSDVDKAYELGAKDFIVKSNMSLKQLVGKVKAYLPPSKSR